MRVEILEQANSIYRDAFQITAYAFGSGEKSLCIVGATRGNEYQQLYVCTKLVEILHQFENEGRLDPDKEIMVIPSCNPYSMNIGKRFWPIDNTDINRMFPGYDKGETTQRIADTIFKCVQQYPINIQLTSYYMPGVFLPHVQIMQTTMDYRDMAEDFDVPYVLIRKPRPYDTTTLNYNLQIWNCKAFSLYTTTTDTLDLESAQDGVDCVLSFMARQDMLMDYGVTEHVHDILYEEQDVIPVRTQQAGFFIPKVDASDMVRTGDVMAVIENTTTGAVLEEIRAPCNGIVFFLHSSPLVYSHTAAIKIIRDQNSWPDYMLDKK